MTTHQLRADREAAWWALVRHLGLDPAAPISVLVPVVIERARAMPPPHNVGLGAATELQWHLARGGVILRGAQQCEAELG